MANKRMMAVLTALLMTGGVSPGQGAASLEQLLFIERLVLANDCAALHGYLVGNPEVLIGDDALTVELRDFVTRVDGGLISCLAATPGVEQPSLAERLASGPY